MGYSINWQQYPFSQSIKEFSMQEEISSPNHYSPLGAVETWVKALTQPNEGAYREIVNDPGASVGKAVLWLLGFGFVGGLLSGIIQAITGSSYLDQISQFTQYGDIPFEVPARTGGAFMSIVGSAFGGLIGGVLGALIYAALVMLVARALGGTGTFEKLFYGFTAYGAPLGMVTSVIGAIPFIGCLGLPLAIYGLVLNVIANKAANDFDTGKAVISSLAPALVIALLCCCVIVLISIVGGAMLAPIFGDWANSF
jgi:hypothetical protein